MTLILIWAVVACVALAISLGITQLIERTSIDFGTSRGLFRSISAVFIIALINGGLLKLSIGMNGEFLFGLGASFAIMACFNNMFFASIASFLLVIIINMAFSSTMFHAEAIANRFQPVEVNETYFHNQEKNNMRIIPKSVAVDVGKKLLNVRMSDGSQLGAGYNLDTAIGTVQYVNGELMWVFPLKWTSTSKYLGSKSIPGYVKVSATDPSKRELITEIDGKPLNITLAYDGVLSGNLTRHVQSHDVFARISEAAFFLTEKGEPKFAYFKAKPAVGFGNYIPDGVYITDAQTGEVTYYESGKEPEYMDYTFSEGVALSMINDWGELREGYIESFFSRIKIKATSYGGSSEMFFIDAKGMSNNTAFFTGLTNGSGNDALVGMLFMDARTGKPYIKYSDTSAPDESAVIDSVNAALGKESDKWSPAQPIPYRIYDSLDIWLTPLVSTNNKLVGYAATKVNDSAPSVWDKTLDGTLSKIMNSNMSSGEVSNKKMSETLKGFLRSYRQVSDSKAMLTIKDVPVLIECDTIKNDSCTAMLEGEYVEIDVIKRTESRALVTRYINSPVN